MDTRQLAAFCVVVERRSFSQAAQRLGLTQPAVSLQVRALEKRLGRTLLDRSGRRVEPTEAGWRLYRSAQRLLALEDQLLEEVSADEEGELTGTLGIGASSGPGGSVVPNNKKVNVVIGAAGFGLEIQKFPRTIWDWLSS